ncbi:MAG TPA: 30S ribosomal protein S6 [Desulfuromonadales bacterium]|jgi:small subunit ribosomal protein S6
MRTYETIFIIHPDVVGDAYTAIVDKFKGVLTDQGSNVLKVEEWGTRKLAYTVKKQGRGSYVLMAYEAGPQVIAEFERRLRIDENVIKFQTVFLENGLEETAVAKEGAIEAPVAEVEEEEETEENA